MCVPNLSNVRKVRHFDDYGNPRGLPKEATASNVLLFEAKMYDILWSPQSPPHEKKNANQVGVSLVMTKIPYLFASTLHPQFLSLMKTSQAALGCLSVVLVLFGSHGAAVQSVSIPWYATPYLVADLGLQLVKLVPHRNLLIDLGSGDGRIPIMAVQQFRMHRAIGYEFNEELVKRSRADAKSLGLEKFVEFRQENLFYADVSKADVVFLYLLDEGLRLLERRLLAETKADAMIVLHDYPLQSKIPHLTLATGHPEKSLITVAESIDVELHLYDMKILRSSPRYSNTATIRLPALNYSLDASLWFRATATLCLNTSHECWPVYVEGEDNDVAVVATCAPKTAPTFSLVLSVDGNAQRFLSSSGEILAKEDQPEVLQRLSANSCNIIEFNLTLSTPGIHRSSATSSIASTVITIEVDAGVPSDSKIRDL